MCGKGGRCESEVRKRLFFTQKYCEETETNYSVSNCDLVVEIFLMVDANYKETKEKARIKYIKIKNEILIS